MMRRRDFLAGALAAAALPRLARAIGPGSKFRIAQLIVPGGNWNPRPNALKRLQWQIDLKTSIDTSRDPLQVRPDSERLHLSPFLYLAGDRAFAPLGLREIERLRRFVTFGGFLLIDNAEGRAGGPFEDSARKLVADLFPSPHSGLESLPPDHVVYKSFFLVDSPAGRVAASPRLEAVFHDKRAAVVYSANDLGGAWDRDDFGNWAHQVYPGGETQREMAFRLGINLAMYALCLDYKTDQVHVPFILKRRRWNPTP
jgi:hypothetical protein